MAYTDSQHPSFHKHDDQICEDPQCHQRLMDRRTGVAITKTYATRCCDRDTNFDGDCDRHPPKDLAKIWDEVESLRAAGNVKRWHVMPIIGEQTVAAHSGHALSLLLLLHPNPSLRLIKAVLWHDTAERAVGDVPSTARARFPDYFAEYARTEAKWTEENHPNVHDAISWLDDVEKEWLRAVDTLELIMFCSDQLWLGNRHCAAVRERAIGWIRRNEKAPIEVVNFLAHYEKQSGGPRSFA